MQLENIQFHFAADDHQTPAYAMYLVISPNPHNSIALVRFFSYRIRISHSFLFEDLTTGRRYFNFKIGDGPGTNWARYKTDCKDS